MTDLLHTGRKQRTPGKESKKGSVDFGVAPSVAESLSSVNCKKEYSEKIDPQKVCEAYLYPSVQPGLSQLPQWLSISIKYVNKFTYALAPCSLWMGPVFGGGHCSLCWHDKREGSVERAIGRLAFFN